MTEEQLAIDGLVAVYLKIRTAIEEKEEQHKVELQELKTSLRQLATNCLRYATNKTSIASALRLARCHVEYLLGIGLATGNLCISAFLKTTFHSYWNNAYTTATCANS